jgi:hypothetical protein
MRSLQKVEGLGLTIDKSAFRKELDYLWEGLFSTGKWKRTLGMREGPG